MKRFAQTSRVPFSMRPSSYSPKALRGLLTALVVVVIVAGLGFVNAEGSKGHDDTDFVPVTCERVVDGDTLVVSDQGSEERVRLIGIDAPESVHPDADRNTEAGRQASDHLKSLVQRGDTLWLQKDVSETDQYDRLLRYVWLERPTDADKRDEIDTKMLNAIMIKDGYAQAREYGSDTRYADEFERLERAA